MRSSSIMALIGILSIACTKPKSSQDDTSSSTGSGSDTSIYDIQQGNVDQDVFVTLNDVIVTSPINQSGSGFYVSEPEGGEYSGVYVYLQGSFTDLYLSVGDKVSVTGQYTEYYDFAEITVNNTNSIQVTGVGEVQPTVVSGVSDWEPYEGVLVQLNDQTVEDCINNYGEVNLSEGIKMDDDIYAFETERGATYTSLVGLMSYNYEEWKLEPRSADDMVGYTAGEGCSATCAEIQQEGIEGGTELDQVVVTSPVTDSGEGFFVQDAGGGEWAGMYVYMYKGVTADVAPGDVVDISGSAGDYYDFTELSVSDSADIVATGETADVYAESLTEVPTDWESWESVLVTLTDVGITSSADSYGEATTDWDIVVDDMFFAHDLANGATCASITGQVVYNYEAWKLEPRTADDLDCEGGSTEPVAATCAELQQGTVTGAADLSGVIATTDSTDAGFYVQDAGGGEYSGVYVYLSGSAIGAVSVSAGDVLDLSGSVGEYYDLTEFTVSDPADVTVTGSDTPTSVVLTSAPADWEPYEGVLVDLEGIALSGDADSYGVSATSWTDLSVDDDFYDYSATYGDGDSFSLVTGPITYTYSAYKVLPRSAADMVQ